MIQNILQYIPENRRSTWGIYYADNDPENFAIYTLQIQHISNLSNKSISMIQIITLKVDIPRITFNITSITTIYEVEERFYPCIEDKTEYNLPGENEISIKKNT